MLEKAVIEFFASFAIWFLFLGLFILWLIDGKIKKELVLHAIFAFLVAWVLAMVLKYTFHTLRPNFINGLPQLVLFPETNGAFPSAHAAASFALSFTLWLHNRKIGWVYIITSILIGISRILANVHYPVDILAGGFLGILIALGLEKVHPRPR